MNTDEKRDTEKTQDDFDPIEQLGNVLGALDDAKQALLLVYGSVKGAIEGAKPRRLMMKLVEAAGLAGELRTAEEKSLYAPLKKEAASGDGR